VRTYSTGQAKEGALADSADEMKDTTTVRSGGFMEKLSVERTGYQAILKDGYISGGHLVKNSMAL
jgi:hypothetical protein